MSYGASIFLLALGAILSFAVTDNINGIDLTIVGYILMGAGLLGLILSFAMVNRRGDTTTRVVEERRDDDGTLH